ncbi:MAG: zinc ribbon-containing protein [Gammaproteobacteria bacterium]
MQSKQSFPHPLALAYDRMLARAKETLALAREETLPSLKHAVESASQTAIDLGELTREEADRVAAYIRRDLHDAAAYLQRTERELADWLRFDFELVEDKLGEIFAGLVDQTRLELDRLAFQAASWRYGEIAGPGTLRCERCGEEVRLAATHEIPRCPNCGGEEFRRAAE